MGSFAALPLLLLFSLLVLFSAFSNWSNVTTFKGIDVESPIVDVTPSPLTSYAPFSPRHSKDVLLCDRIRVAGQSRLKLGSYASEYKVTLVPSVVISKMLHSKIQICFHRSVSRGLCQCEKNEWKAVQNGVWRSVMSPYEDRYVDVKFVGEISGSVTVTVEEEFQRWHLICLAFGFVLLLLVPEVWVFFYYSSSMAIGVLVIIRTLLFQVSVFVRVGIALAEAGLGYLLVRKFIIFKDGSLNVRTAQFVKWAMRVIAAKFIFQSTLDTPLAMGALASCLAICFLITSCEWNSLEFGTMIPFGSSWRSGGWSNAKQNHVEYLSRPGKVDPRGSLWNNLSMPSAWSNSPAEGLISPFTGRVTGNQQDYYSTFHNISNRKKFSKKEWENFTQESTRQALTELASLPEFIDWMIKKPYRMEVLPADSSDEIIRSGTDSTNESGRGTYCMFWLVVLGSYLALEALDALGSRNIL